MREIKNINSNWFFSKTDTLPQELPDSWDKVDLPHTWNNIDGMDGGNDYYRGNCTYVKYLQYSDFPQG